MFMLQTTDGSIGHGTVNVVLVLALCQHTPSVFICYCRFGEIIAIVSY